ncbi:MAG: hypothetical protein M0R37_07885 [Bacteroidales bacterium]|nr:hypothetical protein [Bacteroidales bacterium]
MSLAASVSEEAMSQRCTAHSSRTGAPCKHYAIKGGTVCRTHGGAAPQVKAKAEERIALAAQDALQLLLFHLGYDLEQLKQMLDSEGEIKSVELKVAYGDLLSTVKEMTKLGELLAGRPTGRSKVEITEESEFDREFKRLLGIMAARGKDQALGADSGSGMASDSETRAASS